MTDISCAYIDREEVIVAYLYGDIEPADRAAFDAHLKTCARCRTELKSLGGVREQLARWNPPEPNQTFSGRQSIRNPQSAIRTLPVWAQAAAAVLVLGASAGLANLNVHYDSNGLSVRTGWMAPAASQAVGPVAAEPWRVELASLEQRLRSDMRSLQPAAAAETRTVSDDSRTRAMIAESEKRQRNEVALQLARVVRELENERQGDLVAIDHNFGVLRGGTLTIDSQQRALTNYVATRVSQQK